MEKTYMTKKGASIVSVGGVEIDNKGYQIVRILPKIHSKEFLYNMVLVSNAQIVMPSEYESVEVMAKKRPGKKKKG